MAEQIMAMAEQIMPILDQAQLWPKRPQYEWICGEEFVGETETNCQQFILKSM